MDSQRNSTILIAICAALSVLLLSLAGLKQLRRAEPSQQVEPAESKAEIPSNDLNSPDASPDQIAHAKVVDRLAGDTSHVLRLEFDSMIRGSESLDNYILRLVKKAKAGDEDSAYFLAEALMYCALDETMLQQSEALWGIEATDPDIVMAQLMDKLVGQSEFYRHEARQHILRGQACRRLGWGTDYYRKQARNWRSFAAKYGQPVALARAASVDPKETDPVRLEQSKQSFRQVLGQSHDFLTLMYASSVVSASTGSDYEFERLAWGLLACEYAACDSLNFWYRGECDMLSQAGTDVCTSDMTDIDYLFRRYPAQFDAARAHAQQLKFAVDNGRWDLIGLQ